MKYNVFSKEFRTHFLLSFHDSTLLNKHLMHLFILSSETELLTPVQHSFTLLSMD